MSLLKVATLSLIGFITPVVISLLTISTVFSDRESKVLAPISSDTTIEVPQKSSEPIAKVIQVSKGIAYARVRSHEALNPIAGEPFLVSLLVRFNKLPQEGIRHNIVTKYEGDNSPYPGWAIGLHRLSTSFRPEIYWKSRNGKGGWFSFNNVNLEIGSWYAITILVEPGNYLSVYSQAISSPFKGAKSLSAQSPVEFLGAQEIKGIPTPVTGSSLAMGSTRTGESGFRGEVAHVLIAHKNRLGDDIDELKKALDGGPEHIVRLFEKENVGLWITENGVDESTHAKPIEFSGPAGWHATS